jgi:hypothetical protein
MAGDVAGSVHRVQPALAGGVREGSGGRQGRSVSWPEDPRGGRGDDRPVGARLACAVSQHHRCDHHDAAASKRAVTCESSRFARRAQMIGVRSSHLSDTAGRFPVADERAPGGRILKCGVGVGLDGQLLVEASCDRPCAIGAVGDHGVGDV